MISDRRLIIALQARTDHEGRRAAAASLRFGGRTAVVCRESAFIPDDEKNAVASGAELGSGENSRNVGLKPLIRGLKAAIVSIFVCIRSDVSIVDCVALGEIRRHLGEGH